MRALWLVRSDLEEHPGGDTTQIFQTAAALRRRGISIVFSSDPKPDLTGIDLVHLFHLDRLWENVRWSHAIRASSVPSVLSPIYWPSEEFDRFGRLGLQGFMSRAVGANSYQSLRILQRSALPALVDGDFSYLNRQMFNFSRSARFVLKTVDAVLPNSLAELLLLEQRFGSLLASFIVPNAADTRAFAPPRHQHNGKHPDRVLCVGRIEPRKNQLVLIRALKNSGVDLQIVGEAGHFSHAYARMCRKEATPNIEFLGWRPPSELPKLYQSASVHVSASWYETPGLASLEAARCGCSIVVTPGGSTREYFREQASYCSPSDTTSIRNAVLKAVARPASLDLSRRIGDAFTWEIAGERTLDAYDLALKCDKNRRRYRPRMVEAPSSVEARAAI